MCKSYDEDYLRGRRVASVFYRHDYTPCDRSSALSAKRRLHRTRGAFEWVSDVEGWTIRGIKGVRGCRRGKGDLMGDSIGPGGLEADGVDGVGMERSPRSTPA